MPTMDEIVEGGARIFEAVEKEADKLYARVGKLEKVFADAHDAGMCGALAAGKNSGDIRAIQGLLGEVKSRLYALHRVGTDMAIEHGVDLPTVFGGGGR